MLSSRILETLPQSIRIVRKLVARCLLGDVTFQQFRVLSLTYEGMGQTQMAQTLQVSRAAVSKVVDQLVRERLLQRVPGEDRRTIHLTLTREGEKIRKGIRAVVENEIERSFKKLTKKEQTELLKGLEVLDKLMGSVNEN
jgi:DNA-binding MarR family transcriptional regulator